MKYLVLLFALIAAPLSAQTALPPAPYANQQIADPALERKANGEAHASIARSYNVSNQTIRRLK